MKRSYIIKTAIVIPMLFFTLVSCTKEDLNDNRPFSEVTVKLKTTSVEYQHVYVEIEDVQFRIVSDTQSTDSWKSLKTIDHNTINLLNFSTGSELVLVDAFQIESMKLYEIRLVLKNNCFIDLNNTLYSLDTNNYGNNKPSNLLETDLKPNRFYEFTININLDDSLHFNEAENMMFLNPILYTAVTQYQY